MHSCLELLLCAHDCLTKSVSCKYVPRVHVLLLLLMLAICPCVHFESDNSAVAAAAGGGGGVW